jgi:TnpA family transposase/integrase
VVPVDLDELVEHWTLLDDERDLVAGKRGPTRLGFALLLKFYARAGRFPRGRAELDDDAVAFVARQVGVPASDLGFYEWSGRTCEYHRAQIRRHLGFRECSAEDASKLTGWLAGNVCQAERRADRVREELLARCRAERIEPPSAGRSDRIIRSALHQAEQALTQRVTGRLGPDVSERLAALAAAADDDDTRDTEPSALALIKSVPGNVSLESMLTEITKLGAARAIGLPDGVFADVAPKVVAGWRARAAVEAPSHLRTHPRPLALTLLAALVHERQREVTDTLADLLISTVHRIGARAERKVTQELVREFRKVAGKETLLFRVAEAAIARPDGTVRAVVYPVAGEKTLRDLVAEYKSSGPAYRRTVQTTLRSSYTGHYRRGLIKLLEVLEFRTGSSACQPVINALALIRRHAAAGSLTYYPAGEHVPAHAGISEDWKPLVYRTDQHGGQRVVRMVYEVVTFQALREHLRCKEIWVTGAGRWRDPDEDLPADFETRRAEHYASLRKPLDPEAFITGLREEMRAELDAVNEALPRLDWLQIAERREGNIKLTPLDAAPEPRNLRQLKKEITARWGTVPLIDMLKEAVLRTGCLNVVTSAATRGDLDPGVLAQRLLLAVHAYGTNTGIRAVAAGEHGHGEDDIRYVRRRYLSPESARAMAVEIANATFAARHQAIWGVGSTAVASDSTHFGAFDQNIFTEWHARYGGRGVLIYWHVERKSMAIHSQLIGCSASEVAAMIEGVMRHGTTMDVEASYTDTHGQSEIGFGITRLLGFDLLPRIKRINKTRLYRPAAGDPGAWPRLEPALTRPIRWDLIAAQYDQMIKYATAIRTGTASTEAILRRFTKANSIHPAYQAMAETGRAQRTIFLARYLRNRDLQREINEGLNVVEPRQRGHLLRQGRRHRHQSPRRAGTVRIVPADPPGRPGLRQYPHGPGRARRRHLGQAADRHLGQAADRRGQAGSDPAVPPGLQRTPARRKARQLARHLRAERPDYAYLKEVFRHLREELGIEVARAPRKLPYVPTEAEISAFYDAVWKARRASDVVLIKTLLYTGVRVAELVRIRIADVDLDACRIRITQGKGGKDRVVPFPAALKETLALHIDAQRRTGAVFLFESSWKKPYSDRGVRKILARYTQAAGITASISPHTLRHFLFTWLKTQGIDDALIQPYSGHATRQSLEIYSRLALADAQQRYDDVIGGFPV